MCKEESRPPIGSDEYNDEPVYYCMHCLSLAIRDMGFGDCCGECGSTAIAKGTLEQYDRLFKAKYGSNKFYK